MTGEPTTDLMMAIGDLAERLSLVALLLIIAFAFLRRWVVPKGTLDDAVAPYKQMAETNGKLGEIVSSNKETTQAVRDLTGEIREMIRETSESRQKMTETVGELKTLIVASKRRR